MSPTSSRLGVPSGLARASVLLSVIPLCALVGAAYAQRQPEKGPLTSPLPSNAYAGANTSDFKEGSDVTRLATSKGPGNAPVTIIEFSDFECPFSGKVAPEVQQLLRARPEKVRLIFKHSPLPFHSHSMLAHEASEAAAAQGK